MKTSKNNTELFFKNGDKYQGSLNENKQMHGKQCTYIFQNGASAYQGDFKENNFHGEGKYTDKQQNIKIMGTFNNGTLDGKCKIQYSDGSVYQGIFVKNLKNDKNAEFQFPKNHIFKKYQGSFQDDQFSGFGKLYFTNENCFYEGEFHSGNIDGKGKLVTEDYECQGVFKNGLKNGECKIIFKNGDSFTGQFQNDLKHGYGVYTYKNGSSYEGEYQNDLKNGKGILKIKQESKNNSEGIKFDVYDGYFEDDQFSGQGTYILSNNDVRIEGQFKENFLEGKGKIIHSDVKIFSGNFERNLKNGNCEFLIKNPKNHSEILGQYKGEFVYNKEKVNKQNFGSRF